MRTPVLAVRGIPARKPCALGRRPRDVRRVSRNIAGRRAGRGERVRMNASTDDKVSRPARLILAVLAAVTAAGMWFVAGQGRPAAAAPARPAAAAGTVTTIAGGVGGPAPARSISVVVCRGTRRSACGFSFAGGSLYFTDLGW